MKILSELTELERDEICIASEDHARHCDCELCLYSWALMGHDEDGNFGPFSIEQIRACCQEQQVPFTAPPPRSRGLFLPEDGRGRGDVPA